MWLIMETLYFVMTLTKKVYLMWIHSSWLMPNPLNNVSIVADTNSACWISALQCYLVFCLQTVFQCLSACTHWTNPVCPCKCLSLWMCTHSAWLFPVFCWVTRILNHLYAQGGFQLVLHSRCFWCGKSRTVISLALYLGSHNCFNNTLLPQWGKMLSNKIIA